MSETIDRAARSPSSTPSGNNDASVTAAAAVAAQAARDAAQGVRDPVRRAELGWGLAEKAVPDNAGPAAQAVARTGVNARTAMERPDLSPEQRAQVRTVVERLGNAVLDGRLDPHVNDTFRQHLYTLATGDVNDTYKGALSQLQAAAEVLDRAPLAKGTRVAYDPRDGGNTGRTGLPATDVPGLDADLYYRTKDGVLHLDSAKLNPGTLSSEVRADVLGKTAKTDGLSQLARQQVWQGQGTPADPRALGYRMPESGPNFDKLLDGRNIDRLSALVGGDETTRRFTIGDRAYSIQDFRQIVADGKPRADAHVEALRQQHIAEGNPPESFKPGKAYGPYYEAHAATPELASRSFGREYGEPRAAMKPLPPIELPTVKQGGVYGAAGGAVVSAVRLGLDGRISVDDALEITKHTALGGATGAVAAAGERVVTPMVDRAVGTTVQRAATTTAARVAPQAAAETSIAFGAGARTLATRVGGASVVGAAIGAGVSAYENRHGLARGESKAIGNVVADTGVAVGSVAAAMATGAAVGSIVPVAGTAVGAVVGLAVGVGVAYGAQISGARDAVADTVSGWVDGVKGWF
jgi:hypothetical protein